MTLATNLQPSLKRELSGVNDVSLPRTVHMFRSGSVAFLAPRIQFRIFGLESSVGLFQLQARVVAPSTLGFKRVGRVGFLDTAVFVIPVLKVVRDPSGGGLIPLVGQDVMVVPNLHQVTLLSPPTAIGPYDLIPLLHRRVS
jgi:hypothetical protein